MTYINDLFSNFDPLLNLILFNKLSFVKYFFDIFTKSYRINNLKMSNRKGRHLDFSEGTTRSAKSLSLVDYYNSPHNRLKPKNYLLTSVTRQSTNNTSIK